MRRWIWVAVLVFVVLVPALLIWRKHRMARDLDAWLDANGFVASPCRAGEPLGLPVDRAACWSGRLDDRPVTILLGTRWQPGSANVPKGSGIAQDSYVGIELAGDGGFADWRGRLGPAGDGLVRAVVPEPGRVTLVWSGLHTAEVVAGHLADLKDFLTSRR